MNEINFSTPSEAIFEKKFAKNKKPLFNSQIELATEIMQLQDATFQNKNAITVRSALSQIFTGERNISKNLRGALFAVIRQRFDEKEYNFEEFEHILLEKFKSNYEDRLSIKRNPVGDKDHSNLIEATKIAKEFLIATLEPAELHKSELANHLKDELLLKTGIVLDEESDVTPASYTFYLPNKKDGLVAREFWEKLRSYLMDNFSLEINVVNDRLESANKSGKIRIFLVHEKIAAFPVVFLDYSSRKVRGFCVSYINDNPGVAELYYEAVYIMLKEIYNPVEIEKDENEYKFEFIK